MPGIKATATSLEMLDVDTAVTKTMAGYVKGEQIVAELTPPGVQYRWELRKPSSSVYPSLGFTGQEAAACSFTPDVAGAYTLILVCDGNTYTLTMGVDDELPRGARRSFMLLPRPNAEIATPTSGRAIFCSEELGGLAQKDSTNLVSPLGGGGGQGTMYAYTEGGEVMEAF